MTVFSKTRSIFFTVLLSSSINWGLSPLSEARESYPSEPFQYCLALRGNGENQPAHWGALASLVERMGLPEVQAGGSSASISMFVLENIAANRWVRDASNFEEKKQRAALLLKSLHGIFNYFLSSEDVHAVMDLTEAISRVKALAESHTDDLKEIADASPSQIFQNRKRYLRALSSFKSIGIGDSPKYQFLLDSLGEGKLFTTDPAKASQDSQSTELGKEISKFFFYAQDFHDAVKTFGSFNAKDTNLFFRDGIINFRKFGKNLGKVATFLSGLHFNKATTDNFDAFVSECSANHRGSTWTQLAAKKPKCPKLLNQALRSFFADKSINWEKINVVNKYVGETIRSLPTTTLAIGSEYWRASRAYNSYHNLLDRSAAQNYEVRETSLIRFGYWGRAEDLLQVGQNLSEPFSDQYGRKYDFRRDSKSRKFLSLGTTSWENVLAASPAEPGLASIQEVTLPDRKKAYSFGGWSDLHPVIVLKAAGCDQVVYVTRKGEDSKFAQGVAHRMFHFRTMGDPKDSYSLWGKLYNSYNPKSSFMTSVATADAVLCTDWDRFKVLAKSKSIERAKELDDMVEESYRAPYFISKKVGDPASLEGALLGDARGRDGKSLGLREDVESSWLGCRVPPQQ